MQKRCLMNNNVDREGAVERAGIREHPIISNNIDQIGSTNTTELICSALDLITTRHRFCVYRTFNVYPMPINLRVIGP